MEMLAFGVLIGVIMSAILIMGGVCYAERVNKRTDKAVLYMDSCGCVLRDGDSNGCDSLVGTDNREEPCGCDMSLDAEEALIGLQYLRMALSPKEKQYLDYACNCIEIVDRINSAGDD